MDQRLLVRAARGVPARRPKGEGHHPAADGRAAAHPPVTLSALENGKNVSAEKVERYLQTLGFRIVVVPKSASVEVRE